MLMSSQTSSAVPVFPPGPKSLAVLDTLSAAIGRANYTGLYGIVLSSGSGAQLTDADGNTYLDCLACASSTSLGYGQDFLVDAYANTARKLQQSCFTYSPNEQAIALAELLITLMPGEFDKRVMIGLSGSDASGGAIKAARKFTKKLGIIHFKNDYHGSTGLSQQASDFGTLDDGIYGNDPNFVGIAFPTTEFDAAVALTEIDAAIAAEQIAAVICEAIQGDAGVVVPPAGFIASLRQLTAGKGVLLICDEVQAGMGRTGQWWAYQHEGIVPDLMVTAKGITSGYAPLSAVIGRADVLNSLEPGQHIFTYGGHPPSAAVALATLNYIASQGLVAHAGQLGQALIAALTSLAAKYPAIMLDVRGRGLMIGVQINIAADPLAGKIFASRCVELGAYVGFFGVNADVVRIEPPLIIQQADADFIVATMAQVAAEMAAGTIPQQTVDNVKKYSIGV